VRHVANCLDQIGFKGSHHFQLSIVLIKSEILTEFSNQAGTSGVWCPFTVSDRVVWVHVETKVFISSGEVFVSITSLINL
jgi:hypothetical protein